MTKKVAIINPVGFDGGGGVTLCLQYAKIGLPVIMREHTMPNYTRPVVNDNISTYSSQSQLIAMCEGFDRLIFVNLYYGKITDSVLDDILALRSTYKDKEICFIHCYRKTTNIEELLPICDRNGFMFDCIFSLHPHITDINRCPAVFMNINAFTQPKYLPASFEDRHKVVFTSGRPESLKGTLKYFSAIDDNFLQRAKDFLWLHEGANFTFSKSSDSVNVPPQLLLLFDKTHTPKTVLNQYTFKRYGEEAETQKFNLYPQYNVDDVYDRWKYYYAGVCCILGTKSSYIHSNLLFDNDEIIADSRERTLVEKHALNFSDTLEYADIEKICAGVPVLFSKKYASIIGFNDNALIYDSFSEIPDKVNNLSVNYDKVRNCQYEWLSRKLSEVNSNIIAQFTKETL